MTTDLQAAAGSAAPPTDTGWVTVFDRAASGVEPATARGGGSSVARDRSLWLLFDGRLFERRRLAHRLGVEPRVGSSDAELLLRAWRRWGTEAPRRIRGTFALLVWERDHGRLTAARDPLGIHPLFWAEAAGQLLVSSSMRGLLGSPGVRGELNRAALAERLLFRWPRAEETVFAAVRRVLPGHLLTVSGGGVRQGRYWDPLPEGRPVDWIDEGAEERFERVLERAVDRCLEPGPSAVYLSGGLDSISVAALAVDRARRRGGPLGARRLGDAFRRTVLPLALQARGRELLHASAVEGCGAVTALCGPPGAGKSTLAYGLTRRGCRAWADDAVLLEIGGERVRTRRLPFGFRLRGDSAAYFGFRGRRERTVARAPKSGRRSAPLTAIVILERGRPEGAPADLERLAAPAAVAALLSHAYCFSLRDPERNRRMLSAYFEVAARVPVYRLRRGEGLGELASLLDRLAPTLLGAG